MGPVRGRRLAAAVLILGGAALVVTASHVRIEAAVVLALGCLGVVGWDAARRFGALRARLGEQEQRLDAVAATSPDWLWRATPAFQLTSCPGPVRDMLGYEPAELVGQGLLDLVDPQDRRRARDLLGDAVAGRGGWTDERLQWRRSSGGSVALHSSATPISDAAGHLVGFQGICQRIPDASTAIEVRRAEVRHRTLETVGRPGGLTVALQPIVELGLGRMVGVEALSRFPGSGVGPDRWFAEAHDAGAGVVLERHALAVALETLADLPDPAYLSVNASPAFVLDPTMRSLLARPGLA